MRIQYNAPITLTYTLITGLVLILTNYFPELKTYFIIYPQMNYGEISSYFRLFTHVIGHGNMNHFVGNFTFILLLGPILEEKYSSKRILAMIIVTALITSILTIAFSSHALLGASGIVFMFIILSSVTNLSKGRIPLTFILITGFFLGKEVVNMVNEDSISQSAHIIGGICGGIFGFIYDRKSKNETPSLSEPIQITEP